MNYNITGILIASGFSGRMKDFKPLLEYGGVSFIVGITLKLALVCDEIIVVVGHEKEAVEKELKHFFAKIEGSLSSPCVDFIQAAISKTKTVFNEQYKSGMFSSLKKGLSAADSSNWYLYHFADQPALPLSFYVDFAAAIDSNDTWIQPLYQGMKGHPVLFDAGVYELIAQSANNLSLRDLSSSHIKNKKMWDCNYGGVLKDIDSPEDYAALIKNDNAFLLSQLEAFLSGKK